MKKFLQKPIAVILAMMLVMTPNVFADDYEPADEPTNSTNEFILDADNTGGDITIQFGASLGEFLKYDAVDLRFELSDPLSLEGNELEDFRIENLSSDPACTGGDEGRVYYNTGSDALLYCDGSSFSELGAGGIDQANVVYVDATRAAQVGEVYATLGAAITYVNTQSPGIANRWVIIMEPGLNTETVTIPEYTLLLSRDEDITTFTGTLTLSTNSIVQGITAITGEIDIGSGVTGYIRESDVNIDDGVGGGIDGTLVVQDSFIDGEISATGSVMAYNSTVGATGLTNDGTLATYHSTVLTLTNNNIWNNFGVAYNNSISGLTSTNTQAAIDELRTSNTFTIDSDDAGSDQVQLNFGTPEFLLWDDINDYFFISDALVVDGNVNLQGTVLTLDSDNGAGGANVSIVAEQGSDNNGILQYNATTNQWEIDNGGGSFEAVLTGDGTEVPDRLHVVHNSNQAITGSGYAAVTTWSSPEVISASSFTFNTTTGEVTINRDGWYMISAHGGVANTGTGEAGGIRSTAGWRLTEDTGGGFTAIPGTFFATYSREQFSGQSQGSVTIPRQLSVGDLLRLEVENIDAGSMETDAGATGLFIVGMEGVPGPQGTQGLPGTVGLGTDETSFTIDQDEGGNPNQNVDIIAGQGSEPNGIIRYNDANNRWEASNDGGSTFENLQGGSGPCGDNGVFWSERGTVNSNEAWALGNGQTPFGSPMGCDGSVTQIAAVCTGTIGTALNAVLRKNDVATSCTVNLSTTVGQATISSCTETFVGTDVLGVYAGTESGAWTECVGTFWVDYD